MTAHLQQSILWQRALGKFHSIVYRVVRRLITLDVTHLVLLNSESVQAPPTSCHDITFRLLTPSDVESFSADESNDLEQSIVKRLELGDCCFAAILHDSLAGYAWFASGSIPPEFNRGATIRSGVGISFPDHMRFLYKGYVHPRFRGQRLYGWIVAHASGVLSDKGVTHILSTADWTNFRALKSCYAVGYQFVGCIWRFGYRRRMYTLTPKKAEILGIRFD